MSVESQASIKSVNMSLTLNRSQRAFNQLLRTCLHHNGLTSPEWYALGMLRENPLAVSDLSSRLLLQDSYTTRLVKKLIASGFVQIIHNPDDGRVKILKLSDEGSNKLDAVEIRISHCLQENLTDVDERDLEAYMKVSEYIADNFKH